MLKLDKRLLVNISKTAAATALLSVLPTAFACGITWLSGGCKFKPMPLATAAITVMICTYWLHFKKGRNFNRSVKDGAFYFDYYADKVKRKSR